jgi:hypothetical protein
LLPTNQAQETFDNIFLDLITQEYLPKQDLLHQKLPVAPSLFKIAITRSQKAAMAGNQPTVADLQLLIQQLKGRVLALQGQTIYVCWLPLRGDDQESLVRQRVKILSQGFCRKQAGRDCLL